MKLLTLTDKSLKSEVIVNLDQVHTIRGDSGGTGAILFFGGHSLEVTETPEEIDALATDAGPDIEVEE
jgi:hypothetical protein